VLYPIFYPPNYKRSFGYFVIINKNTSDLQILAHS